VLIYDCPETTSVPLPIRSGWLRQLYPQVHVIEVWDGPSEVGDTPSIKRQYEDYVLGRLGLRGITHFYCSEFYGEHMSLALGAVNVQVDAARRQVPISATAIRQNTFEHRYFPHPPVYRDLVARSPSTIVACLGIIAGSTMAFTAALREVHLWWPGWSPEKAAYPFWDALTTAMSFVAMWQMARRRIESWIYWIVLDVIGIWLYTVKDVHFVALLYVFLLGIAVHGLWSWHQAASAQWDESLKTV
jgi:hypothetical protein